MVKNEPLQYRYMLINFHKNDLNINNKFVYYY